VPDVQWCAGGKDQQERVATIARFKDGSADVLCATDIAGKGLDFDGVPLPACDLSLTLQPSWLICDGTVFNLLFVGFWVCLLVSCNEISNRCRS
jgi:hypothetical protein